jgi:molybdopterin-guanine dinucleotide biosynthesis protein A
LILAGGKSRRMGRDKTWLELGGAPLIAHVIRRLLPIASEVVVSADSPGPVEQLERSLSIPLLAVRDQYPDAGPLAGLHAGLSAIRSAWAFTVAADMPFVNVDLVRRMLDLSTNHDAVVPRITPPKSTQPELEPLHALYNITCLPAIEDSLRVGDRRMVSFLPRVRVAYVGDRLVRQIDPNYLSFFNINTTEDLARAARLLAGG